tara:strand:- start:72966 stop:73175 length:210 start_codon:yes stop_codon:yes gene_type:complete
MTSHTPLITEYQHVDTRTLQDNWLEVARTIELSMLQAGAVPGTDYSYLDLYKLAQPIVLQNIKNGDINL